MIERSGETLAWLNTNTLIGFKDQRQAWHYRQQLQGELGNHFDGPVPRERVEALFGFELQARPMRFQIPATLETATDMDAQGNPTGWVDDAGHIAIVRSDRPGVALAVHGSGYKIHQYPEWLVHNVDRMLSGDLAIGSAGLLRGGAIAWVSVEVPDTFTTAEGVAFRPRLLNTTSCDGSLATRRKMVFMNAVCDNTLDIALKETGREIRIKHSSRSDMRRTEALEALGLIHASAGAFEDEITRLCQATVTDRQWSQFMDAYAPAQPEAPVRTRNNAERKREDLTQLWTADGRVSPWKGTQWGAYMAVNTYNQWVARGTSGDRTERAMERAITGRTRKADELALATLDRILSPA
jgi:phage/plasmid-like protein (TIGR03299 family)